MRFAIGKLVFQTKARKQALGESMFGAKHLRCPIATGFLCSAGLFMLDRLRASDLLNDLLKTRSTDIRRIKRSLHISFLDATFLVA